MRKQTLYSSSSRTGRPGGPGVAGEAPQSASAPPAGGRAAPAAVRLAGPAERAAGAAAAANAAFARPAAAGSGGAGAGGGAPGGGDGGTPPRKPPGRFSPRRVPAVGWFGLVASAALALSLHGALKPEARKVTQNDIDRAVLHTLEKTSLPSAARKAYDVIRPSVVRVQGVAKRRGKHTARDDDDTPMSTGTGVIVVESGLILTNLHVVDGATDIRVTFADGTESPAQVISTQPQNDLAVLQPRTVPDDVVPATLRGTADLAPGDTVVAVGFPFGIGPSVSAGVVSGLKREYESTSGKSTLTNLIQFDAAANPGSSGGPLVTAEGEVVGIVTAILNPSDQRVFIGIGFAVPIENAAGGMGLPPH